MQYASCNSAPFAQETLFLTKQKHFLPKDIQKVRKLRQILICDKIASQSKLFGGCHPCSHATSATLLREQTAIFLLSWPSGSCVYWVHMYPLRRWYCLGRFNGQWPIDPALSLFWSQSLILQDGPPDSFPLFLLLNAFDFNFEGILIHPDSGHIDSGGFAKSSITFKYRKETKSTHDGFLH